jgi:hypothetical protein
VRLGPFEINRDGFHLATKIATVGPASISESSSAGATGTVIQDGYIVRDEWNSDLRGKEALKTFRKMRRRDGSVREAEQHIFAPIKNATWEVEPYSDDPEDLEIAAAVRACYFKWADYPFQQHLHQALIHLSIGRKVFEYGFDVVEDEVSYDDPSTDETITVPSRQYVTIARFEERLPETIVRWPQKNGRLAGIVQQAYKNGNYEEIPIPVANLLVFTNEQEGDDYEGYPILESAYPAWFLKRMVERTAGAAVERHGMGVWVAYPPESQSDNSAEADRLEEILSAVGLGDSPYIIAPGPKQTADTPGYVIELQSPPGQLPDFVNLLEYLRGEIKGNMLVRFSELGHGRTGARSTGDTQSQVWYAALHAAATYVAEIHNKNAIPRFVRMNFGVERFPTLVVEDIESRSLEEYAKAVALLTTAVPELNDTPWRQWIRRSLDAPDADEEEAAAALLEEEPPPDPSKPDPAEQDSEQQPTDQPKPEAKS